MNLEHALLGSLNLRFGSSRYDRLCSLDGSLLYLGLNLYGFCLDGFCLDGLCLGHNNLLGLGFGFRLELRFGFGLNLGLLLDGLGGFGLLLLGLNRLCLGFLLDIGLILTQVYLTYSLELYYRLLGDDSLYHLGLLLGRLLLLYRLIGSTLSAHTVLKETVGLLAD